MSTNRVTLLAGTGLPPLAREEYLGRLVTDCCVCQATAETFPLTTGSEEVVVGGDIIVETSVFKSGFDVNGRPVQVPGSNSTPGGSFVVYPTAGGATNFQAPSYSPLTGLMYLEYAENGQRYASAPVPFESGRQYIGRTNPAGEVGPKPGDPAPSAGIKAIDPETGKPVWDFKIYQVKTPA